MFSSGSSWASMSLTRWKFGKNTDELAAKNIIDAEENTHKNASDNMMAYAAYEGKWNGIWDSYYADPVIGFTMGSMGLLTHYNPYVSGAAFGAQGSSETWAASLFQSGDVNRKERELKESKQELIASVEKMFLEKEKEESYIAEAI